MVGTKKAVLAQLVERSIRNAKVRSSILRDGSNEKFPCGFFHTQLNNLLALLSRGRSGEALPLVPACALRAVPGLD